MVMRLVQLLKLQYERDLAGYSHRTKATAMGTEETAMTTEEKVSKYRVFRPFTVTINKSNFESKICHQNSMHNLFHWCL